MTEQQIKQLLAQELANPTFGVTQQFLAIHRILHEEGLPVVRRIAEAEAGIVTAYMAVEGHKFYLAISIATTAAEIVDITTEAFHDIWLRASSEELTTAQMLTLTHLTPIRQYNKGDVRMGTFKHKQSVIDFQPRYEPDTVGSNLYNLLSLLEQDTKGIRDLAAKTECVVRVASYFHNGNGMLGGHFIDASTLKRISNLNVSVDFDLYAEGNSYLDE
ncbi:DUF4279 domain-containing protein [Hymenobacter taeanensis]|uniref:DUF4279 domain-containing protein n=1 Tax=Hymenobacter taeanensis TaxID=2735321 RepID=A0A6M6BIB7_9BACT|nr:MULTISPECIES: DUF4279 domain-containing protein [Hymenobacter]QJX47628.1 DUF4279 domain-containing protein [Hymenobacter taeanensis]UOQ82889.1 DUF4279 domain-containing protein [Hymenobacter sp. 5414T-23]